MKKPNRRSKRTSVADSSPSAKDGNDYQHYEKRVRDLEKENEALKTEIEELNHKLANVSPTSTNEVQKLKEYDPQKLHDLEEQVMESKEKLNAKSQLSTRKQKNGQVARLPQDEIQRLKAQKVQLLCKMKLESVQFRLSKASLEKEVLQLKKEQRRNEYEMRKLLALNQRQKLVLQRKTEEASMATKRLNELLESRKALSNKTSGSKSGNSPGIQALVQGMELELKVAARVEEIRSEYERQMEEMADEVRKFEEEAETLRQENLRFLLQDKEADCVVRDSELRDLKEEVVRLSNMVSQLGMPKAQGVNLRNPQVDLVKSSASVGSSIELLDMDASESEYSGVNIDAAGKSASGACCSCSKKSLCKTTKCGCRAAGGSCGTRCGCAASKCTNREVVGKVDDSLQKKVAQNLVHLSGTSSEIAKGIIASQPAELNNDFQPRRKPLREIKNALINLSPVKHGQKTRRQKPTIPLDISDPSFSLPENAKGPMNQNKLL